MWQEESCYIRALKSQKSIFSSLFKPLPQALPGEHLKSYARIEFPKSNNLNISLFFQQIDQQPDPPAAAGDRGPEALRKAVKSTSNLKTLFFSLEKPTEKRCVKIYNLWNGASCHECFFNSFDCSSPTWCFDKLDCMAMKDFQEGGAIITSDFFLYYRE